MQKYPYLDCNKHGINLGYACCIHIPAGAKIKILEEPTEEASGEALCSNCANLDFSLEENFHLLIAVCSGCISDALVLNRIEIQ